MKLKKLLNYKALSQLWGRLQLREQLYAFCPEMSFNW